MDCNLTGIDLVGGLLVDVSVLADDGVGGLGDGINYDDVESVNISNGKTFNSYDGIRRTIIRDENTMLKGQDGSLGIIRTRLTRNAVR